MDYFAGVLELEAGFQGSLFADHWEMILRSWITAFCLIGSPPLRGFGVWRCGHGVHLGDSGLACMMGLIDAVAFV